MRWVQILAANCTFGRGTGNALDPNAEGIDNVNGDGMVVRNCHIHHTSTSGVYAKGGADGCIIDENLIRETGEAGILLGFIPMPNTLTKSPIRACLNVATALHGTTSSSTQAELESDFLPPKTAEPNTTRLSPPLRAFRPIVHFQRRYLGEHLASHFAPSNENITLINNIFVDESGTGQDD
ncbi:MAG: right-handed parallel beta-helix repeat-containing protein [Bacteroidetes bacterium]|nr:right-handed parallel beta-helix repeat-containing protein [Bacteroidota bacterium]